MKIQRLGLARWALLLVTIIMVTAGCSTPAVQQKVLFSQEAGRLFVDGAKADTSSVFPFSLFTSLQHYESWELQLQDTLIFDGVRVMAHRRQCLVPHHNEPVNIKEFRFSGGDARRIEITSLRGDDAEKVLDQVLTAPWQDGIGPISLYKDKGTLYIDGGANFMPLPVSNKARIKINGKNAKLEDLRSLSGKWRVRLGEHGWPISGIQMETN